LTNLPAAITSEISFDVNVNRNNKADEKHHKGNINLVVTLITTTLTNGLRASVVGDEADALWQAEMIQEGREIDWVNASCSRCGKDLKCKVPPDATSVICFDCDNRVHRRRRKKDWNNKG